MRVRPYLTMIERTGRVALVVASAFVIEVIAVWVNQSASAWAIVIAHLVILLAAFQLGRAFLHGHLLLAALLGLLFGALFWFASWRFLGWLMVDAFQRENETGFIQFSGPYSLYLPPTVLLSGLLASLGAWKRKAGAM